MAAETAHVRNLARRVKQKALEIAEDVLTHPENYPVELYHQTYLTTLKNAVPRTQEITGEDGEPIRLAFDPIFNDPASRQTEGDSQKSETV
ncbi:MAG: hypothetical protein ACLGJB_03655 [Blastocatellia bacterium]